jgi:hypothetical protein
VKKIDVQSRLEYARCAVAVLRALKLLDAEMTYKNFGNAIGLISDGETWQPWHQQQTRDVLNLAAATERQAAVTLTEKLDYHRIINARKGKAGKGIEKASRLVRA